MGRNLLFIVLCVAIIFVGIDVFKPIDKKDSVNLPKQKVKIQKPLVEYEEEPEELVVSEKPILIYFYTDWCGACKKFAPYWNSLVESYGDKYRCVKINAEAPKYRNVVRSFNIEGYPELFIYDKKNRKKEKLILVPNILINQLDNHYNRYYK